MDPSVGPSRTVHRDARSCDSCECLLKKILHRIALGLALPARIRSAIYAIVSRKIISGNQASFEEVSARSLIDHSALMFGLSSRFSQRARGRAAVVSRSSQGMTLQLRRDLSSISDCAFSAAGPKELSMLRGMPTTIARTVCSVTSSAMRSQGSLCDIYRFQRMRQHAEFVTQRNSHASFTRIDSENASSFHLKIPHHKPKLRNNMSFISFDKFGDNLPVTGIVALSSRGRFRRGPADRR